MTRDYDAGLNRIADSIKMEPSVMKAFMAAVIHILGTLVVVFNSARLVRFGESLDSASA